MILLRRCHFRWLIYSWFRTLRLRCIFLMWRCRWGILIYVIWWGGTMMINYFLLILYMMFIYKGLGISSPRRRRFIYKEEWRARRRIILSWVTGEYAVLMLGLVEPMEMHLINLLKFFELLFLIKHAFLVIMYMLFINIYFIYIYYFNNIKTNCHSRPKNFFRV
jgi:hypothetical protein